MITGPGWKPRIFTNPELDEIESRRPCVCTMEELTGLLCRAISRLSPEEKAAIRAIAAKDIEKARRERDDRLLSMPCPPRLQ